MRVYGWNAGTGGCGWYRVREPLRGMSLLNIDTAWGAALDEEIVSSYDTILVHILWQEAESEAWEILAREGAHKLVFDIDDDVWQYDSSTENAKHYTPERLARVERNIRISSLVTTPSETLAQRIYERGLHDKIWILPNYVPESVLSLPRQLPDSFTVGYQGAPQHKIDLELINEELYKFLVKSQDAKLRFYGPGEIKAPGWPTDRLEFFPWESDVMRYYSSLAMHVGIAPLTRIPFNDAKSAIRAVEYSALGIPAIYSNRDPYRSWVIDGVNGFIVPDDEPREWSRRLSRFYRMPGLVKKMSDKARDMAKEWTTEKNAGGFVRAYESV